jgi:hypothetical protein
MAIEDGLSAWTMGLHLLTLFLVYAYVKEELVFSFLWALSPSLIVFAAEAYHLVRCHKGIRRAKYIISYTLLLCFLLAASKVVKNEGGVEGTGMDDHKWLVKHRRCFLLLAFSMGTFILYSALDGRHKGASSVVKEVLLNIFSALSMPLSVCSGGACTSIYLSTVTSILSSLSVPLTMVVPILNYLGFALQLFGLMSIYTANKWKSIAFWVYVAGMSIQIIFEGWIGCVLMIVATILNAKFHQFTFGSPKLFKSTIL